MAGGYLASMTTLDRNHHPLHRHQAGFTLIELMVVITLMVMLMLTASSVLFTTLVGTGKTGTSSLIKQEGDFAIDQIEFLLRNAIDLRPAVQGDLSEVTCAPSMDTITFKNYDNGITTLSLLEDPSEGNSLKIASSSANGDAFLTSSRVEVVNGPVFSCTQSGDGSGTHIDVQFTLRKGTPGLDQARDIIEQTFQASVNVRNDLPRNPNFGQDPDDFGIDIGDDPDQDRQPGPGLNPGEETASPSPEVSPSPSASPDQDGLRVWN